MPPAVHPGWIHWSVGGQTSGKPGGGGGGNMTPHDGNMWEEGAEQTMRLLTHSCWRPWGWTPGRTDMWACWQRTGREHVGGGESPRFRDGRQRQRPHTYPGHGLGAVLDFPCVTHLWRRREAVSTLSTDTAQSGNGPTRAGPLSEASRAPERARTESSMAYVLMKWASRLQIHRDKTSPRRRGISPLWENVENDSG